MYGQRNGLQNPPYWQKVSPCPGEGLQVLCYHGVQGAIWYSTGSTEIQDPLWEPSVEESQINVCELYLSLVDLYVGVEGVYLI